MALHSKKEFADKCGIQTRQISIYVKRRKIVVREDDLIDDANETNKRFIAKSQVKKGIKDVPAEEPATPVKTEAKPETKPEYQTGDTVVPDEGQSYEESERQLKYLDTLKRAKEIELLEMRTQKIRGEVVPSELFHPVFLQHNQSIMTEFKNAADEVVRIFAKKRTLSVNEVAEIRKDLVQCINSAVTKAAQSSAKAVKNIISEYSEKRGVGERG